MSPAPKCRGMPPAFLTSPTNGPQGVLPVNSHWQCKLGGVNRPAALAGRRLGQDLVVVELGMLRDPVKALVFPGFGVSGALARAWPPGATLRERRAAAARTSGAPAAVRPD